MKTQGRQRVSPWRIDAIFFLRFLEKLSEKISSASRKTKLVPPDLLPSLRRIFLRSDISTNVSFVTKGMTFTFGYSFTISYKLSFELSSRMMISSEKIEKFLREKRNIHPSFFTGTRVIIFI